MKFTKLYFTREDLKEKLGIESHQFAIVEVKNTVDEVEFTLAIDDDAITKGEIEAGKIVSSSDNLRRFRLIDGKVATYDIKAETIKVTDNQGETVFEMTKEGRVKSNGNPAKLHTKEKVLTSKEAKEINKTIDSILNKSWKTHETDNANTHNDISEALNKAEQVFNIVFNVTKESKNIGETITSAYIKALQQINEEIEKQNKNNK